DDEGRVPVPADWFLVRLRLRLDVHSLARLQVEALQVAVLRLGVYGRRVLRIGAALETVPARRDEPIGVGDAMLRPRSRRPAEGEVVLGAAVDVVKGERVVDVELVELGDREVGEELVVLAAIEALVQTTVATDEEVLGIVGIDPDDVVVDVLVALA